MADGTESTEVTTEQNSTNNDQDIITHGDKDYRVPNVSNMSGIEQKIERDSVLNQDKLTIGNDEKGRLTNIPSEEERNGWEWATGISGEGDKPDWLDSKYKTVEEQAKANNEAQKYIGELKRKVGLVDAPKVYDWKDVEDSEYKVPVGDPLYAQFEDFMKESKISQEVANKIMGFHKEMIKSNQVDVDKELGKLGDDGREKRDILKKWMNNNLEDKQKKWLDEKVKNADDILMLYSIKSTFNPPVVTTGVNAVAPRKTKGILLDEFRKNLYKGDNNLKDHPENWKEWQKKLSDIL